MSGRTAASGRIPTNSLIVSAQPFILTIAGTTATQALTTSVNPNLSTIHWGNITTDSLSNTSVNNDLICADITFQDGSTLASSKTTGSAANYLIHGQVIQWQPFAVESIQRFQITIAAASTSNTFTLTTPVDTTRSFVMYEGHTVSDAGGWGTRYPALTLTNTSGGNWTKVTATKGSANSTVVVRGAVILMRPGILNNVQNLSTNITGTNTTGTLSAANGDFTAVDPNNSFMTFAGFLSDVSGINGTACSVLMDGYGQNITATRSTGTSTATGDKMFFSLVSFKPGMIKGIQRLSASMSGASPLAITFNSVNINKSFPSVMGFNTSGTTAISMAAIGLPTGSSLQLIRAANTGTSQGTCAVVEYF